jgi:uncharacterized protein YkwD
MARTGTFSHVGSANSSFVTRVKATGYGAPLSENIAWGYRDGAQVVSAWMKSPAHRANIVNCKAKVGRCGRRVRRERHAVLHPGLRFQ